MTIAGQSAGGGSVMSQMACMDNEGLFHRAVVMSAMIRSPYQVGGIGVPEELWHAEEMDSIFFLSWAAQLLSRLVSWMRLRFVTSMRNIPKYFRLCLPYWITSSV